MAADREVAPTEAHEYVQEPEHDGDNDYDANQLHDRSVEWELSDCPEDQAR